MEEERTTMSHVCCACCDSTREIIKSGLSHDPGTLYNARARVMRRCRHSKHACSYKLTVVQPHFTAVGLIILIDSMYYTLHYLVAFQTAFSVAFPTTVTHKSLATGVLISLTVSCSL